MTASFQNFKFEIAISVSASRIPAVIATKIQLRNCGRDLGSPNMNSDTAGEHSRTRSSYGGCVGTGRDCGEFNANELFSRSIRQRALFPFLFAFAALELTVVLWRATLVVAQISQWL